MIQSFKSSNTESKRILESSKIRQKYPEKIPVIVQETSSNFLDKNKFLVDNNTTVGQFLYVLRKRMNLSPEKALFVMCNDKLMVTSELMKNVYDKDKDADGFLYFFLSEDSVFG